MQRIFQLQPSQWPRAILTGICLLVLAQATLFRISITMSIMQLLLLIIYLAWYRCYQPLRFTALIKSQHGWVLRLEDKALIHFAAGPHSLNRKYWVYLHGRATHITLVKPLGRWEEIYLWYWRYIGVRITVFKDMVAPLDWCRLKQVVWATP